ncbi:MAG TPA: hypothetical protein VM307_10950 [Egibacteraceae bacterium]|nr:hypothetical protein [Egibacteraceae bacterium]
MPLVRNALGGALAGTAQVLSLTSKVLEATARTLRPDAPRADDSPVYREPGDVAVTPPSEPIGTEAEVAEAVEQAPEVGRVSQPPPTPLLDETPRVRTSATHIEDLANKPASEVVSAVSGLSTDELRLLTEYEMDHRNRKTVLQAIEKALVPS